MRLGILIITLVFIAGLGYLTALDFAHHGVTLIGILALFILVVFGIGIVGALRHPPSK